MATFTRANFVQPQRLTTTQRNAIAQTTDNIGVLIWNTTTQQYERWDGSSWEPLFDGPTLDAALLDGVIDGGSY